VPVEEELAVVRAYLDIESLRLGDRLKVEHGDRSKFVGCSHATFLFATAGGECGPARTPFLTGGRPAAAGGPNVLDFPRAILNHCRAAARKARMPRGSPSRRDALFSGHRGP
jgi:hypothetical protein